MLSDRIAKVGASETLRIMTKAEELRAEGFDVINMSVGEPDFLTPENIKEAGKAAIDNNFTKYTPNAGLPELKRAVVEKLKRDNNLDYSPDEIIVSSGAKNSLYNLFMAILDKDDEVIIPAPYWVSYPQQVRLAGGRPVIVETKEEDGFRITPEALIRFALSYDITVAIVGCSNAREVKTLAAAGRHLGPLSGKEKAELMERLEPYARRLAFYRGVL